MVFVIKLQCSYIHYSYTYLPHLFCKTFITKMYAEGVILGMYNTLFMHILHITSFLKSSLDILVYSLSSSTTL